MARSAAVGGPIGVKRTALFPIRAPSARDSATSNVRGNPSCSITGFGSASASSITATNPAGAFQSRRAAIQTKPPAATTSADRP